MKCKQECVSSNKACQTNECRHYIDFDADLNCSLVAADNGPMTLEEVAKRVGLSLVRIKQIEEAALKKLSKRVDIDMVHD